MKHRAEIAGIIASLAEYYDKTLTAGQLAMYVEDLLDLTPAELHGAVQAYRRVATNDRFPLPAKLIALARPPVTDEQNALDAVSRILAAIQRFGPYRSAEAAKFIGELGWFVVQRDGGWLQVCQITDDAIGTARAQWREMAKAFSARSRAGVHQEAPQLPAKAGSTTEQGLVGLQTLLPRIGPSRPGPGDAA